MLAGIAFLYTANRKIHVCNVSLCLLMNFILTNKAIKLGFYENQIEVFLKIGYFRIIQIFALFYIAKINETKLLEAYNILRASEININTKLTDTYKKLETMTAQLNDIGKFKATFLSCFSHEVRNPLNILIGSIDILLNNITEKSLSQILQGAKFSSELLLRLVNNVLDASNIQTDKFELSYGFHSLRSIVTHVVQLSLDQLKHKRLTLQVYIDKKIPEEVYMDAGRFLQLLINLVSNSIKFSEEGQLIQVYLTWHHQNTPRPELLEIDSANPFVKRLRSGKNSISLTSSPTESPLKMLKKTSQDQWLGFGSKSTSESSEVVEVSSAEWTQRKCINTSKLDTPLKKISMGEINSSCEKVRHKYNVIDTNIQGTMNHFEVKGSHRQNKPGILKVEVSDQGCGISKEDQCMLFELFTQVDSSITRRNGGIGLGLWVTKQIIEKAGGEIKLYSEERRGTTFVFYIPLNPSTPPDDSMLFGNPFSELQTQSRESKLKALVADDIKFNRDLLKMMLEEEGVEVHLVQNGLEAVQVYKENPGDYFDFILTDIQMPLMDGVTAARQIRSYQRAEGRKEIDIYIVSGNCSENEVNECLDPSKGIGAKDFLVKPIKNESLKNIVKRRLKRRFKTI